MANIYDVNAAIDKPNLVGAFQQGMQFGQQQRALREQRADQQQLRQLAPQILAGDPTAYQRAAVISPEAAGQYQSAGDAQLRRLKGAIDYIDKAPSPEAKEAAFQQVRPYLAQITGKDVPATFAETAPAFEQAKARIAMLGQDQNASAVQSTRIGKGDDGRFYYFTFDRAGNAKNTGIEADPRTQIIEGKGGFYGVNQRNFEAAPVNVGGNPAAQASGSTVPQRMTDEQIIAFANQMAQNGVPEAQVNEWMKAQQSRPMFVGSETATAPQQLQAAGPNAPAGFQWNADRTALTKIPGGPADEPEPTAQDFAKEEMAMRKELADQTKDDQTIASAFSKVNAAAKNPTAQNDLALIFAYMKMLDPGSVVREGEFANAQNAAGIPDRIANAYNRALRGERLNPDQRAGFVQSAQDLYNGAQQRIVQRTRQQAENAEAYGYDPVRATGSQQGSPQFRQQFDRAGQLLQEARAAIQQGKDPAAVKRRLIEMGFGNIAGRL